MELTEKELEEMVKKATDKALKPYLKVKRPDDLDTDKETPGKLKLLDDKGVEHRIYRPNEKMAGPLTEGLQENSFGRILRANIIGNNSGLSYEEKALSGGVGSAGGFLVDDAVVRQVLDKARNQACVFKAGGKTFIMEAPTVRIVKIKTDPTAYFVAENQAITESEWEIEPITLIAMTIGVIIRSSLELIQDAPNAAAALQNSMAAAISQKLDLVCLRGDGVNEPRGIANCDDRNIINKGTNGATITTYDDFSNAVEDVYDHNGVPNAVIMAPRTYFTIDRLKQATVNEPLSGPASYQDLKKFATNQVAIDDSKGSSNVASRAYVGDFSQVLMGIRKGLEIETTRSGGTDTFLKCQLRIRARMRIDIAILREAWFTVIEGIIP
ncbi:hypothetical protein ES702_00350 [subsurface metagenome]